MLLFKPCHVTEEAESSVCVLSIWAICVSSFLQLLDLLYSHTDCITHKFSIWAKHWQSLLSALSTVSEINNNNKSIFCYICPTSQFSGNYPEAFNSRKSFFNVSVLPVPLLIQGTVNTHTFLETCLWVYIVFPTFSPSRLLSTCNCHLYKLLQTTYDPVKTCKRKN